MGVYYRVVTPLAMLSCRQVCRNGEIEKPTGFTMRTTRKKAPIYVVRKTREKNREKTPKLLRGFPEFIKEYVGDSPECHLSFSGRKRAPLYESSISKTIRKLAVTSSKQRQDSPVLQKNEVRPKSVDRMYKPY